MVVSFFAHSLETMEKRQPGPHVSPCGPSRLLPDGGESCRSTVGRRRSNRSKKSRKSGFKMGGGGVMTDSNASNHSAHSAVSSRSLGARNSSRNGPRNSTVDGGNLFAFETGSFRENSSNSSKDGLTLFLPSILFVERCYKHVVRRFLILLHLKIADSLCVYIFYIYYMS
jgi:hypothetical protein